MVVSDFLNKEKVLYFLATNYFSLHKKKAEKVDSELHLVEKGN